MKKTFTLVAALAFCIISRAQTSVSTQGSQYVVIHEMTGAWCGYCPDGADILEQILASNPKAMAISIHDANGYGPTADAMQIADGDAFVNTPGYIGVGPYAGYPAATINCLIGGGEGTDTGIGQNRGYWQSEVSGNLSGTPKFDVSMTHSYNASTKTITINVTAKALAAITGDYNINACITEDSIQSTTPDGNGYYQHSYIYNQTGSAYYHKGTLISSGTWGLSSPDYYHMNVLRAMLGGTWGTTSVIATNAPANGTYTKTYTYVIPSTQNPSHIKITAYVQKNNATNSNDRPIANGIQAKLVTSTTAVNNVAATINNAKIFPNPASSSITVNAEIPAQAVATIAISNVAGQTVFSNQYKANANELNENISLDNLSSGIYFVNISGEGFSTTQKITVNK